jgi:TetR/AcrR family transcriptional regulator, transcriptional repressor for nem operon
MARYGKEHKQATRRRIIEAAGHRLKRDSVAGSGVAALMADTGLTNGAFYAHFDSWESRAAVETFRRSGPGNEQRAGMLPVSVAEYDIAEVRPLFGKGGA